MSTVGLRLSQHFHKSRNVGTSSSCIPAHSHRVTHRSGNRQILFSLDFMDEQQNKVLWHRVNCRILPGMSPYIPSRSWSSRSWSAVIGCFVLSLEIEGSTDRIIIAPLWMNAREEARG